MIRSAHFFALFCLFFGLSQPVFSESVVKSEFSKFFKEPLTTYKEKNIEISILNGKKQNDVIVVDGTTRQIQITLTFNIKSIEKILVLKLPESGYSDDGTFDQSCQNDDTFVAGYNVDPSINISELTFRMRSRCIDKPKRLLVWVKTSNGQFFMGKTKFFTYASHESNNW